MSPPSASELRKEAQLLKDISDATGDPAMKQQAGTMDTEAWYSDRKQTTVWNVDRPSASPEHPTMKPVGLVAVAIGNSTRKDELVLDPFCGSGSTIIAAEQLGRVCYAAEIDPKYCDVIVRRWQMFSNQNSHE